MPLRPYIFLIILTGIPMATVCIGQQQSPKKGIAYGHHSAEDMTALAPGISWWYNWYHQPESGVINHYQELTMDFVPMAWNGGFNESAMRAFLDEHPDVQFLLGFNEPNFVSQANMTPQQAADAWPTLEAIAEDYNLELVAPAVNYCDVCVDIPGNNDNDPTAWLDAFFMACPDCRVDYIAVHWYACDVGALDWYLSLFDKYQRPLWLTEFACWEGNPTLANQKEYMIGAIDLLEQDPNVYRYAWFTGRSNGPYIDLLNSASGQLSSLGELYVNFLPVHDTTQFIPVPARIEAENYTRMSGILLQATADVDGFANVGWIDTGDWLEYQVEVNEADAYPFSIRTAGQNTGSLLVFVDNTQVLQIPLPATGGWQTWVTRSATLDLPEGRHTLRLQCATPGFNLNWLQIGSDAMVATEDAAAQTPAIVYPQPAHTNPVYLNLADHSDFGETCQILNLNGSLIGTGTLFHAPDRLCIELPWQVFRQPGQYFILLTSAQAPPRMLPITIL